MWNITKNVYASSLCFPHTATTSVSRCSCRETGTSHRWFFLSNCLSFCVVSVCVCACVRSSFRATGVGRSVRLYVTSLHVYSQRSKWTRYFPPLGVDIGLSAGNSAFSPLVNRSELFKQEALGRKSGLHSFVNKAGSAVICDNCLEYLFLFVLSVHLECKLLTAYVTCYYHYSGLLVLKYTKGQGWH